jgi:hypothetical protein
MNKVAVNPASVWKALAAVGIGGAGATAAYSLGKGMDYNQTEKILSILGGASTGALAYLKNKPMLAKILIPSVIAAELAPAALRSVRSSIESNQAKQRASEALAKWTSPAVIGGSVGLGALAMTAVPALANISRAADRIGDGRAIRMSTSIRKRPNDPSDLKLEIMTPDQADQEAKEQLEARRKAEQEAAANKGTLSKIF